jgi:hypothetical protein
VSGTVAPTRVPLPAVRITADSSPLTARATLSTSRLDSRLPPFATANRRRVAPTPMVFFFPSCGQSLAGVDIAERASGCCTRLPSRSPSRGLRPRRLCRS